MIPTPGALELVRSVQTGERSAVDVVADALARIAAGDGTLRAFVEIGAERALADAAAIDARRAAGQPLGPLAGLPIALKDNLLRQGAIAGAGSRMLADFVAPYSATAVARAQSADAVVFGRTNMDEFGMGSSTERSCHGPTRNPWDRTRVPGGSSGGAAAAVAAGFAPLALGSDTGGSIRQPAAFCGVTGLKPTYGRVSRYGLIAYASSLDCVGGIARSAADLALLLDAIAGVDAADPTTLQATAGECRLALGVRTDLKGLTFGVPWELNGPGLDADVLAAIRQTHSRLADLGARLVDVALPHVPHAVPTYYLIATAEASTNLARYDGIRFGLRRDGSGSLESMLTHSRSHGFGDEVQLRILLGTFALRAGWQDQFYGQATRVRTLLRQDFTTAFARCDAILCPTSPVTAFPLGARIDDPLAMYLCDALTVPASLAGLPALSLPCGVGDGDLPVGLQIIGPALREDLLLQVGHVWQQHTDWHRRRPPA
ncbi:MAG: Asp-tRNA(Asn)/Glu-tRNA(Gln) amidotransferase subunit GatA [Planctomycetes bacterium]|nr:Asp-tRNA(Asn)/Glu-tRNA(Gln) amidotransferase subunit GatA [Planctomycetota bacterium]